MTPSPAITLFTEQIDPRRPAALFASAVLHAAVLALLSFGILAAPQIDTRAAADRFTVRHLDLHAPEQQAPRAALGVRYPGPYAASGQSPRRAILLQPIHAPKGPQTLLQPDLPRPVVLAQAVPVPRVTIWTPGQAVAKTIVAPAPAPPTVADVHPSLDAPSDEINLGDVDLASARVPSRKLDLLPSSTSPVAVHGASPVQLPTATVTQSAARPTPAAILSASDLRMKNGSVVLPPVNETASESVPGELGPGASSAAGAAPATGQGSANSPRPLKAAAQGVPASADTGLNRGAATGAAQGDPDAARIALPRDGQFSAVIVGDALQDEFPELADVWSGRMAYTVYLHVGLPRSWILQYSLPRSADAAAAGTVARLEAPWPYNIVRPNLAAGSIGADALLVHGFVNRSGRFESLSIVFPQAFPQAQFLLQSLEQWQFRPASQNGQFARVEVLLIIPEDLN